MENQLPKPLFFTLAIMQGILLTLLYRATDAQTWPATEPRWLISLTTLTISFPLMFLLSVTNSNIKLTVKCILPFSLLLSALGGYVGYQQEPVAAIDNSSVVAVFCFTALIASFKALIYIQHYINHQKITYQSLVKISWRHFIVFGQAWLFVLIFWGILYLGAGLFSAIKIEFFKQLLTKDWVVIPLLTLAFSFAITVFRNIISTVDNISTMLQTLIKFLLPALSILSLGFLATLPVTGLTNLWQTGNGSFLIIWLQALTLFFVNVVYQGAAEQQNHQQPYHPILHRVIIVSVALLPIYSAIASYGLWLRIDQYGLTVDRCWAMLVIAVLAGLSIGYLIGIIKNRDRWLETLSRVNIVMGLVIMALMLVVNSPVLNFQAIAATSQMAKLERGEITIEEIDYPYFGNSLGRQGYLKLQQLKLDIQDTHPDIVVGIDRMYRKNMLSDADPFSQAEFESQATFWPTDIEFPNGLISKVYAGQAKNKWTNYRNNSYYFLAIDLNNDGHRDFVVITENNDYTSAKLWLLTDDEWQSSAMGNQTNSNIDNIKHLIINNEIKAKPPKWQDLHIGDLRFRVVR